MTAKEVDVGSIGTKVLGIALPLALIAGCGGSSSSGSGSGGPDGSTSESDGSMTSSGSSGGASSGGSGSSSSSGSSGSSGSSSGSSSGTGSGSSSGSDAGGATDSGNDSDAWTVGSGASNPGYVWCGSTQCDLTTTICCLSTAGGPSCISPTNPAQCPGEWIIGCDEPADCPTGQFCGVGTNAPLGTGCTTTSYWPRICKHDADCGDAGGGVCVMSQSCDGHQVYVSTCGVDQWCTEHP